MSLKEQTGVNQLKKGREDKRTKTSEVIREMVRTSGGLTYIKERNKT